MKNFPNKKFLLYSDLKSKKIDNKVINEYDIILMPNFMLPHFEDKSIDLFFNQGTLSTISKQSNEAYLENIFRITRGYFFFMKIAM